MTVWNPFGAMDRRIERAYEGCDHWIQQKAQIGAWMCVLSMPLMIAVPLVGILDGTKGAGFLLAANVPMLVLGQLGLFLILKGHFRKFREALFLAFGIVHVATGLFVGRYVASEHFFWDFALYADALILVTGVLATGRALLGVTLVEILSIVLMRLLLPSHESGFDASFVKNGLNSVASMAIVAWMTWNLMRMTNRSLRRVQTELEANLALQAGLETTVAERTSELAAARDAAEAANRAKTDFLANMSHEIRTPLHGMLGMVDLVLEAPLPEVSKERLEVVVESGNHLLGIITDILEYSRIEEGTLAFQAEAIQLGPFLEGVVVPLRKIANDKGIELAFWSSPGLPECVTVDGLRLRQILTNLLGNGIKFTHRGEVRLAVDVKDGRLLLVVQDTGEGIAAASLKRIFERFSQADESVTRRYGGTGLGLSISRSLALGMGGFLEVFSEPGKGSTFTVDLPLMPCNTQESSDASSSGAPAAEFVEGLKVLLVDDNAVNRKVVEGILARQMCHVAVAEHGRQALRMLGRQRYDVVLMDCQMPVMDGFEATRILRSWKDSQDSMHREASQLPVIGLTANASREAREEGLESGMNAMLTKPFRAAALREVISEWIRRDE